MSVTMKQALTIAREHDQQAHTYTIKDGAVAQLGLYNLNDADYWVVHPERSGRIPMIGASYLIVVDKLTGKVIGAGQYGE